jgi:hypothetical protein
MSFARWQAVTLSNRCMLPRPSNFEMLQDSLTLFSHDPYCTSCRLYSCSNSAPSRKDEMPVLSYITGFRSPFHLSLRFPLFIEVFSVSLPSQFLVNLQARWRLHSSSLLSHCCAWALRLPILIMRLCWTRELPWIPSILPGTWEYQGCYTDTGARVLSGSSYVNTTGMTDESCIKYCDGLGYYYAGSEYSQECCELLPLRS